MWSASKRGTAWDKKERGEDSFFDGGDIQQKREAQNFGHDGVALPTPVPRLVENPDPPIRNTLRRAYWSAYCNDFKKSESEYFLSK